VVWFVVSSTLTGLALVATVGLLPAPSVAEVGRVPQPVTQSHEWRPWQALIDLADRLPGQVPTAAQSPTRRDDRADRGDGRSSSEPAPPAGSGAGRRVVFDLSDQRVWLVRDDGSVRTTYLVSGSVTDNLDPGRYSVYSRSERATSYDYTSTMRWMVRFTEGATAAIGFHTIPRDGNGRAVQSVSELGTPQSHGCIRQRPRDAKALWDFAPIGTTVVVVA
jgi:hypothetical protein